MDRTPSEHDTLHAYIMQTLVEFQNYSLVYTNFVILLCNRNGTNHNASIN